VNNKILKKYLRSANLHDDRARKWAIYGCLGALLVIALLVRKSLVDFQDPDYQAFSSWYSFVKVHGIGSFKYAFSDYNPPYTYFLYLITLLPISKIVAIKGLLAVFDVILAVAVYLVIKIFRPQGYVPLIAAITTMFLPTVLVTGVMWGQFDQLYVAAMLLSLYSGLRDKSKSTWLWFGVAIAIKFQAIFFLPVLGVLLFKRIRWYDAIWGVGSFLVLTLPPVLAGRSLTSVLEIYPNQASLFNGHLTLNAPNIYQWVPNSTFPYLNHMGIGVAVAACIFILLVALQHKKFSQKDILLCTTLVLYVVPFLLPAMHERYFFPAGIASVVLAFAYPSRIYAGIAVLMQIVTLFSYCPFLFGTKPIPFTILSFLVLVIISVLVADYIGLAKNELDTKQPNNKLLQ
jgi:Gpi18-like mannosyltransferase